jgi:phosphate starvation-inducible PhoH-like protein
MVVTGDVTQVDLPAGTSSGLRIVSDILAGVDDVTFCHLTARDVVRHHLVSDIVEAYHRYDNAPSLRHPARDRGRRPKRTGEGP